MIFSTTLTLTVDTARCLDNDSRFVQKPPLDTEEAGEVAPVDTVVTSGVKLKCEGAEV